MGGRIVRPEDNNGLHLPEVGRLHIGKKSDKGFPMSVDYFIPTGKYTERFTQVLGAQPQSIAIVFPSDDAEQVCNERYEYRDNAGALLACGDGVNFMVWDGKRYQTYSTEQYPQLMEQVAKKHPKKPRSESDNGWDMSLTLRFIIPAVRGIVGVWQFTTKGAASSIKNIRNSFDGVQKMRGTVCQTVFDLSVKFAKSNKPNQTSRYPVVSLVANDNRIEEMREALNPKHNISLLLQDKE